MTGPTQDHTTPTTGTATTRKTRRKPTRPWHDDRYFGHVYDRILTELAKLGLSEDDAATWADEALPDDHWTVLVETARTYQQHNIPTAHAVRFKQIGLAPDTAARYYSRGWIARPLLELRSALHARSRRPDDKPEISAIAPVTFSMAAEEREWIDLNLPVATTLKYVNAGIRLAEIPALERRRAAGDQDLDDQLDFLGALRH